MPATPASHTSPGRVDDEGWLLLRLLSLTGWEMAVAGTAGGGIVLTGHLGREMVRMRGDSVADLALDFFTACCALAHAQRLTPMEVQH